VFDSGPGSRTDGAQKRTRTPTPSGPCRPHSWRTCPLVRCSTGSRRSTTSRHTCSPWAGHRAPSGASIRRGQSWRCPPTIRLAGICRQHGLASPISSSVSTHRLMNPTIRASGECPGGNHPYLQRGRIRGSRGTKSMRSSAGAKPEPSPSPRQLACHRGSAFRRGNGRLGRRQRRSVLEFVRNRRRHP